MGKNRSTGYWDDIDDVSTKKIAEDPVFGIGYALGNLWKKNYNDRGINKELDDLRSQFGDGAGTAGGAGESAGGSGDSVLSAPAQRAENALIAEANSSSDAAGGTGGSEWDRMKALDELGQGTYMQGQQPQSMYQQMARDVLTGGSGYDLGNGNYDFGGAQRGAGGGNGTGTPGQYVAGGTMPQGMSQQVLGNGGTGLQQQTASGAPALPADFDATATLAELKQKWQKNGRTAYQIEKLTELATPMLEKAQKQVNRREADRIMSVMSGLDPANAQDRDVLKQGVIKLSQYDPTAAKVYANDIVTGNQIWNRNNKLADEKASLERQRTLANENANRQIELMVKRQAIQDEASARQMQARINLMRQNGYSDKDIMNYITSGGRRGGTGTSSGGSRSGSGSSSGGSGYKVSTETEKQLYNLAEQADMERENWDPDEHDGQQWQPSKIQQYALTFRDNAMYKAANNGENKQTPLAEYPQNSVIKMMQEAYNSGRYSRRQIEDVLAKERPEDYGNIIKWVFGDSAGLVHSNE